jgi:hypothetical protein
VEKQYVVETRFVGEQPVASATGASVLDVTERVVEEADPGLRCPANTGQILEEAATVGSGQGYSAGPVANRI